MNPNSWNWLEFLEFWRNEGKITVKMESGWDKKGLIPL